jgi:hypothetical protein
MIADCFFSNISFYKDSMAEYKVIFSCDSIYFKKFGLYNLMSCDKAGHTVHVHLINPTAEIFSIIDNLKFYINHHSISYEYIDVNSLNFYQLKTYYYCSRFFITNFLFKNNNLKKAIITDADVIFNEYVAWPKNIYLGLEYKPDEKHCWRQVSGPVVLISKESQSFLEDIITDYKERVNFTDFSVLDTITDKYTRGDILGLDQVCMANNLKKYITSNFLNLYNENIQSKDRYKSKIWIMTNSNAKNKPNIQTELEEMFL